MSMLRDFLGNLVGVGLFPFRGLRIGFWLAHSLFSGVGVLSGGLLLSADCLFFI